MWCNQNWLPNCINFKIFLSQALLAKMKDSLLVIVLGLSNFVLIADLKMHIRILLYQGVWNYFFPWLKLLAHVTNSLIPYGWCMHYWEYRRCVCLRMIMKLIHKLNAIIPVSRAGYQVSIFCLIQIFAWLIFAQHLLFNGTRPPGPVTMLLLSGIFEWISIAFDCSLRYYKSS